MANAGSKFGEQLRNGESSHIGSTKRIQNLNALTHSGMPTIDLHRARCLTKVFQEKENEPQLRKRWKAAGRE